MFVLFLIILVVALAVLLVWRDPELRRRLQALILRRQGAARAVLGIVQPRDLQRQALAIVKEKSLLSIRAAHLPTDVAVVLSAEDYEALGATREHFVSELVEQISALDGADAGGEVRFVLGARPQVTLDSSRLVPPGTVEAKVSWQEGTVVITALAADEETPGPVGGLTLSIEEEGAEPREAVLVGRMSVGRDQGADIRILHPSVSRRHAIMAVRDLDTATIVDLESENGVTINGTRIPSNEEAAIHGGEPVRLSRHVTLRLIDVATQLAPTRTTVDHDA